MTPGERLDQWLASRPTPVISREQQLQHTRLLLEGALEKLAVEPDRPGLVDLAVYLMDKEKELAREQDL